MTKTAVLGSYAQGDEVTYVINIRNTGTIPFSGLTLTDDLGAYSAGGLTLIPLTYAENTAAYFINGIPQAAPSVTAGPPLSISGIVIPASGVLTLIYTARINSFAPLEIGSTLTNTVTLSGGGITPMTASETIAAAEEANLTITKTLSPTVVTENGQITYTFVIQNTGNTAVISTDNALITDIFDPALSNLTVLFEGSPWTAPVNYTYDSASGRFATNPGQLTVPAATFAQDPVTGTIVIQPGVSILTVTGTI